MTNPLPKVGDLIGVTIMGARVTEVVEDSPIGRQVYYTTETQDVGGTIPRVLFLDAPSTTVVVTEPATPAEWPPRPGDLWRDRDQELWFAVSVGADIGLVSGLGAGLGTTNPAETVNRACGPLQLVRREQAEPEQGEEPAVSGWPPQPGDVWRDAQGDDWHVVNTILGVRMHLDGATVQSSPWRVLSNCGPLQLVKR